MVSRARRQQPFSRRWQLGGRQVGREGRSMDWIDGLRRHRGGTARRRAHPCAPADGRVAVDSEHDCRRAQRAPRGDSGNVVRVSAAARSGQKAGGGSGTRGPVATRRDEGDAETELGQAADWSGWRRPIVKRDILEMNWALLKNSLLVSALTTLLATVIGFLTALFLAGLEPRWRRWFLAVAVMALALPPFLVTGCWLHLLGLTGVWRGWLPFDIYSLGGTVWILSLMLWPISLLLILGAWQRLEPAQLEGEPSMSGWPLMRWLLLPLARNALAQSAVVTFVLALNNFAVPAILQVKVFPDEVWVNFNTTFDYTKAAQIGWPLVLAPLLLLVWLRRCDISWPRLEGAVPAKVFRRQLGAGWFWFSGGLVIGTMGLSVGLPLVDLCAGERTWLEFFPAFKAGQSAIFNSALFSAVAAALVVVIALATWRWPIGPITWIPFLTPGVLLGIVLIYLFNRPFLSALYESVGIVFLAWTAR